MNHPFAFLAPQLAWIEKAQGAVIDDWDACNDERGWDKFYAVVEQVQAAERSVRRAMKVYHCVFGPGQSCQKRLVPNCVRCVEVADMTAKKGAA